MQIEEAKILIADYSNQFSQLAMAMMFIVEALKQQPGFDVKVFEARMLEVAQNFDAAGERWTRMLLELAGGKDIATMRKES